MIAVVGRQSIPSSACHLGRLDCTKTHNNNNRFGGRRVGLFYFNRVYKWMWFLWRCAIMNMPLYSRRRCLTVFSVAFMLNVFRFFLFFFGVTGEARGFVCCIVFFFVVFLCCLWFVLLPFEHCLRVVARSCCKQILSDFLFVRIREGKHASIASPKSWCRTEQDDDDKKNFKIIIAVPTRTHRVVFGVWHLETGSEWNIVDMVDVNARFLATVSAILHWTRSDRFECRVKYVRECIFCVFFWSGSAMAGKRFCRNIFMVFNMRVTYEMDGNFSLHSHCAFARLNLFILCIFLYVCWFRFGFFFPSPEIRYRGDIHNVNSKNKKRRMNEQMDNNAARKQWQNAKDEWSSWNAVLIAVAIRDGAAVAAVTTRGSKIFARARARDLSREEWLQSKTMCVLWRAGEHHLPVHAYQISHQNFQFANILRAVVAVYLNKCFFLHSKRIFQSLIPTIPRIQRWVHRWLAMCETLEIAPMSHWWAFGRRIFFSLHFLPSRKTAISIYSYLRITSEA